MPKQGIVPRVVKSTFIVELGASFDEPLTLTSSTTVSVDIAGQVFHCLRRLSLLGVPLEVPLRFRIVATCRDERFRDASTEPWPYVSTTKWSRIGAVDMDEQDVSYMQSVPVGAVDAALTLARGYRRPSLNVDVCDTVCVELSVDADAAAAACVRNGSGGAVTDRIVLLTPLRMAAEVETITNVGKSAESSEMLVADGFLRSVRDKLASESLSVE